VDARVGMPGHTFWLCEVTLLNTRLEGLVEHNIKLGISRGCQALVVGFDIFLDRLSAVVVELISKVARKTNATGRAQGKSKHKRMKKILTCCQFCL
jgi:hypothetical protein